MKFFLEASSVQKSGITLSSVNGIYLKHYDQSSSSVLLDRGVNVFLSRDCVM